jgi:hypothetical protein
MVMLFFIEIWSEMFTKQVFTLSPNLLLPRIIAVRNSTVVLFPEHQIGVVE